MTGQGEILPTQMDTIKSRTLSSYLDNDITERLGLSEPIEPDQSGSSVGNLLGSAAGEQVTNSITEEQSSLSARGKKGKRLLIEDDDEEERGSHHQSSVQPESFKDEEESKEIKIVKPKSKENSSQSESLSTATEEKKE